MARRPCFRNGAKAWHPVGAHGSKQCLFLIVALALAAGPAFGAAPETKPPAPKPAETKATDTKPAEKKPADTKPAEPKPAESKPVEKKPADTKPAAPVDPVAAAFGAPPALEPLPPFTAAPVPAGAGVLVPVPKRSWLPPADGHMQPLTLSGARQNPIRSRPTSDLPPLASESNPVAPVRQPLPSAPLAWAPSPDLDALPMKPSEGRPFTDRPTSATDPTIEPSRVVVLSALLPVRQGPGPFLRLVIPDPFEWVAPLAFRRAVPDDDPAVPSSPPPRPKLPVKQ